MKFRNSLNMAGDFIALNLEKHNKSGENNEKTNKKKVTLTHTYSKPIGISINYNSQTINNKNIIKSKDNKIKIQSDVLRPIKVKVNK